MLFLILAILMLAGASYYIARGLYRGFISFFPKLKLWYFVTGVSILTLFMVMGFARSLLPFQGGIKHFIGIISSYSMGIMLYLLLFTLLFDIIALILKLTKLPIVKHKLFKGFVTVGVLSATAIVCTFGFINSYQLDHVSYEIELDGKKDISDIKVALISDLHLGAVGSESKLPRIVEEINGLEPDIICIAGDFFDTDFRAIQNTDKAIKTLLELKSTYGVYACLGNHDAGETYEQMVAFFEKANVTLLRDEYTLIDNRLVLVGRVDKTPIGGGEKRKELSEFFTLEDETMPVIVMDHNPQRIGEYGKNADLILCGHTHKGQVFPANIITDLIYEVDYGYYQKDIDSPQVIVTSGVHGWGMPMRVGSDCEIVSINFR